MYGRNGEKFEENQRPGGRKIRADREQKSRIASCPVNALRLQNSNENSAVLLYDGALTLNLNDGLGSGHGSGIERGAFFFCVHFTLLDQLFL